MGESTEGYQPSTESRIQRSLAELPEVQAIISRASNRTDIPPAERAAAMKNIQAYLELANSVEDVEGVH